MALFRRKKDDTVLPEVDKYYEGERRDRPVMAWLLALLSIAIVALLIVGLFLGGRWLFDKLGSKDSNETATTSDTAEAPSFDGTPENTTEPAPTESENTQPENSGNTDNSPAPTQPAPSATSSTSTTSNDSLPNTGPADTVAVFLPVSTIAGGTHFLVQRRKATRQ